jgi:hypothetical protein
MVPVQHTELYANGFADASLPGTTMLDCHVFSIDRVITMSATVIVAICVCT